MSHQKYLNHGCVILLITLLLVSACSCTQEVFPSQTPDPTKPPAPTETSTPTGEPTPTEPAISTEALVVEGDNSPVAKEEPSGRVDPNSKAGTDITIKLPEGSFENGLKISRQKACFACHEFNKVAPSFGEDGDLPEIVERAAMRIADPNYTGNATTPEEYLIESIVLANDYIIPGEWKENMGSTLAYTLTVQDLADVIAWMTSGRTAEQP